MSNDKEPECKKVHIRTDTEGHDFLLEEPSSFFDVYQKGEFIIVKTFKDKEHTQLERKYVVNFKFIISIEYTY